MTTSGTLVIGKALIHDLAIVLAGSLHPGAEIGPAPRLAACRLRDVLGVADGETVKSIEGRLRSAFGEDLKTPVWARNDSGLHSFSPYALCRNCGLPLALADGLCSRSSDGQSQLGMACHGMSLYRATT